MPTTATTIDDGDVVMTDDDDPQLRRLAAFVKARREAKGWSQANLAQFMNVSRDVIKRLESGKGDPRGSIMLRVLPILGCTGRDFIRISYGHVYERRRSKIRKEE